MNTISIHLEIFRHKLAIQKINKILSHIVSSKRISREGLGNSQALYGILLGYGKENSMGYENYCRHRFVLKGPVFVKQQEIPYRLTLPYFASFEENEIDLLVSKYKKEREKITASLSKNLLELVLSSLN